MIWCIDAAYGDAVDAELSRRLVQERLDSRGRLIFSRPRWALRGGVLVNTEMPRQRMASG